MTGPFDRLTTSRSSDSGGPATGGGAAGAAAACSGLDGEQPVMTVIAPTRALRIMNARRSTPSGNSEAVKSDREEVLSSRLSIVMGAPSTGRLTRPQSTYRASEGVTRP